MTPKFNLLQWVPAWEIGIPEIDADHRLLVGESNGLFKAVTDGLARSEIMKIIGRMATECKEHFQREENILREARYSGTDDHAAEHRRIERELEEVVGAMEAPDVSVGEWNAFAIFFQSTLINHLLLHDLKFKSHLLWKRGR
jgi:hemerythrin-like metal-binding protein